MSETSEPLAPLDALNMARDLIQEAKGAEGPNGGFVTNHLDAAENWLDKVEAALASTHSAAPTEPVAWGIFDGRHVLFATTSRQTAEHWPTARPLYAASPAKPEAASVVKALDKIIEQHPDVSGSDEEAERLLAPLKPAPPHDVYGPYIPMARAIVHEYLDEYESVRKESRNTDIWGTAEYMLRVRIASALALLHPVADTAALDALRAENERLRKALTMPDAERRLWFISDCLGKRLYFNRADICEAFGVSVPQASADIKRWIELHPGAIEYDRSNKRYVAALSSPEAKAVGHE